jgi:hypothetical protein
MTHVNLKRKLRRLAGIVLPLGLALTLVGGTELLVSSQANAAGPFTDTAVQAVVSATAPVSPVSCGSIAVTNNNSANVHYTATGGTLTASTWTVSLGSAISFALNGPDTVLTATGAGTGGTAVLSLVFHSNFCGRDAVLPAVTLTEGAGGVLLSGNLTTLDVGDSLTLNHPLNDNGTGDVGFSAVSAAGKPWVVVPGNLPAGLTPANPLVPGTAAPGTYHFATEVATDGSGALAFDEFTLKVLGHQTINQGAVGDEVNGFDNGFDVFRQHFTAGAIVVGWDATKGDPATHFLRIARGGGVWQFEALNGSGIATGLCVSDPGGGWADPIGPNGLLITPCNSGPFQQWTLVSAEPSQLKNVATGLLVSPDGTGVQLQGAVNPATVCASCDSHYTWKDLAQLP